MEITEVQFETDMVTVTQFNGLSHRRNSRQARKPA